MSGDLAAELAGITADQSFFMPNTATRQVYSASVADGYGGHTQAWVAGATFPIAISLTTALAEQVRVGQQLLVEHGIWKGRVPKGTVLNVGDRLTVNDGHTYQVLAVDDAPSFGTVVRILCDRIP